MKFLIMLMLIVGCSSAQNPQQSEDQSAVREAYNKLITSHEDRNTACLAQEDNVLKKAIFENKDVESDWIRFVKDDKEAASYINNFDTSKLTTKESNEELDFISAHCQLKTPIRAVCGQRLIEYDYFQGLLYGLKNYKWSTNTKMDAKELGIRYAQHVIDNVGSVIHKAVAIFYLKGLAEQNLIDKKLASDLDLLDKKVETIFKSIRAKVRNIDPTDCNALSQIHPSEQKSSKEIGVELQKILDRIK